MLINNSVYRANYVGNGVQTQFPVPFPFLQAEHLAVDIQGPSDTAPTRLSLGTHYTVTGMGNEAGGTVTLLTPPVLNAKLAIFRSMEYVQQHKYRDLDNFPAASHEDALALLTMMCQQLQEQIDRALLVSTTGGVDPSALITSLLQSEANSAASAAAAALSATEAANQKTQAQASAAEALAQANAALASANAAAAKLQELINAGVPVPIGMMAPFPVNRQPSGWAVVMGQTLQRTVYPQAVTFLTGNNTTPSFTLPDLRGEFVRGADLGRGVNAAVTPGAAIGQSIQSHTHTSNYWSEETTSATQRTNAVGNGCNTTGAVRGTWSSDPTGGAETAPRHVGVVWCIKLVNHPVDVTQADINAVLAALNTMAQAVNPNNGKYASAYRSSATVQALAASTWTAVSTATSPPTIVGDLGATYPDTGVLALRVPESGTYMVQGRCVVAAETQGNAYIGIAKNGSRVIDGGFTLTGGGQGVQPMLTGILELDANDIVGILARCNVAASLLEHGARIDIVRVR